MENHILSCYDKDLTKVRSLIIKMATLVGEILEMSSTVFDRKNSIISSDAKNTDRKINRLDEEIESLAIEILALRSPKASDLRETVAALKIAVILERMGDLSKNITRKVVKVDLQIENNILKLIKEMMAKINNMLHQMIESYTTHELTGLDIIFLQEQEVDDLYNKIRIALEDEIVKNKSHTSELMTIIFAIKNYERIADYITKIAYIFKYIVTGERRIYED